MGTNVQYCHISVQKLRNELDLVFLKRVAKQGFGQIVSPLDPQKAKWQSDWNRNGCQVAPAVLYNPNLFAEGPSKELPQPSRGNQTSPSLALTKYS